jgi:hypothetical protein
MTYHPDRLSKHSRVYLLGVHLGFGLLLATSLALFFGYVVMLLWNAVLPALLSVRSISYWQSVGLLALARILVGGFGHGKHGGAKEHRNGEAWRKYDDWWKEVGEQSFGEFSQHKPEGR